MNGRTIERLESRFCLSSHHGGDFHFVATMHHGGHAAGAPTTVAPMTPTFQVLKSPAPFPMTTMPQMHSGGMYKFAGGGGPRNAVDHDGGYEPAGGNYTGGASVTPVQHAQVIGIAVISLPDGALIVPLFNIPPMTAPGAPAVDAPAPSTSNHAGAPTAQTTAAATTPPNAGLRDNRVADVSQARQLLSEAGNAGVRGTGGILAATARSATGALAASAGNASARSVMERLTSKWHDGIVAAAVDVAQASIAHLVISPEALVSRAVDAANNLLAPVAQTAGAVMSAVTPVASVTSAAAYDIAHMGSPFALLADSLAGFVEESASVTNVIAQADKRGPWTLTATVIAADVTVLTYVYRRKSIRRRAQLAMPDVA